MDIYKRASKQKLKISTTKGELLVEQLWDLTLEELDSLATDMDEQLERVKSKTYLKASSKEDTVLKLRRDIVVDIIESKVKEGEIALKAAETKAKNQRIIELIAKKQDEQLEGKTLEELEAMLEEQ